MHIKSIGVQRTRVVTHFCIRVQHIHVYNTRNRQWGCVGTRFCPAVVAKGHVPRCTRAMAKARVTCMLLVMPLSAALLVPSNARGSWEALGRASSSVLFVERPVSVLRFCGDDRRTFLHGLCTANVNGMKCGAVVDATVVDSNGNALELLSLFDSQDNNGALFALGSASCGEKRTAFFDRYIFPADAVTVADVSEAYECMELIGPSAAAVLADVLGKEQPLPAAGTCVALSGGGVCAAGCSLGAAAAYTLLSERESGLKTALSAAALRAGGVSAPWDELRILRGRPLLGAEFDAPEGAGGDASADGAAARAPVATPLELGLWGSVHLDKGCYLGQEVIARVARAKRPRRELYGVQLTGSVEAEAEALAVGAPLLPLRSDGTADTAASAVGTLTSLLRAPAAEGEAEAGFGLALVKVRSAKVWWAMCSVASGGW